MASTRVVMYAGLQSLGCRAEGLRERDKAYQGPTVIEQGLVATNQMLCRPRQATV